MVEAIFYLSGVAIFYVYVGYPFIAAILGMILNKKVKKKTISPQVTVLIAAYNEREVIEATIRNKLGQQYPEDRLEIIVVSDGSTDGTDEIVHAITDSRVRLLRQEPRNGKTSALNLAVPYAKGEIIVFSDANSIYACDSIQRLLENFSDSTVGYVTGKMIYADVNGTMIGEGCSAYMKYENMLRSIETHLGSIVGVDGGIDAVRKNLYQPMRADQLPDFVLPLKVIEQGYRVVYEPKAALWESSLKEASDEYRMRVRVSLRAMWALFCMRKLLRFGKDPLFAWQLWSHKVLRYLCFLFLILAFFSNMMLLGKGGQYQLFLCLQVIGYLSAIGEPVLARKGMSISLLRFGRYFVLINLASAHAFIKFLSGKKQVLWTPRKG